MPDCPQYPDLLRMSVPERQALLQDLDKREVSKDERQQRRHDRHRYHVWEGLAIRLRPPQGEWAGFRVTPRNISAGGLSFLHGSFVYPGTQCAARLRTLDGEYVFAEGQIVRCRVVGGKAYEVSVAFNSQIDVGNFVAIDVAPAAGMALPYDYREVVALSQRLQQLAARGAPSKQLRAVLADLGRVVRKALQAQTVSS